MARPRNFDEARVLEAAADVFWSKGYEATSTRDLSAHTGLTASSIYAAFGDKRELFHRALDHYLTMTLRAKIERLDGIASPSGAIREFFADIVERSVKDAQCRGCMMVNSALEASHADTRMVEALAEELTSIESFFARRLADAQRKGEIPSTPPARASAKHLLALLLGVRVLARVRPERKLLTDAVRQGLASAGVAF